MMIRSFFSYEPYRYTLYKTVKTVKTKTMKPQYVSSRMPSCGSMGKGMHLVSDLFDFIGKVADKFKKVNK